MKVIVTGGCGFIGSHVVDYLLSKNHEVLILDNFFSGKNRWSPEVNGLQIANIDIIDSHAVERAFASFAPQAVFHMAAHHFIPYCGQNPDEAYKLNVSGTVNVLMASWKADARKFFLASTADVYAPSPRAHYEDDAVGPFTVYGRTKLVCETICRGVVDWGWPADVLIGRIFNAVGPRETNPHLVPEVVAQLVCGNKTIQVGNVFPTRDFVDVETQAHAIVDATLAASGVQTVNIGSGIAVSVQGIIDTVVRVSGKEATVQSDPQRQRPSERVNLCANVARLRQMIGYTPRPADDQTIANIFAAQSQS